MRILLYLERSDTRGGIEVFAERHADELRAGGDEVAIAHDIPGSFDGFDEIVVHKCGDLAALGKFPPEKTVYYVHDHEPICPRTYAYTPLGNNCTRAGGCAACFFCAPLCRNWKVALKRLFSQRRRLAAMAKFKKLVVISNFMKSRLVANGLAADSIEVRPPRISGAVSGGKPDGGAIPDDIDILYVGQLIRGKGVHLLLEALAKTRRRLDIVGAGNMEPKLRALAKDLGVADRVRFDGFRTNPGEWMRRAACVAVPSFWQEPYGLVAAEAVALGKPVVAFAVGGLPEACGGKATLVPPGDVDALAAALDGGKENG